MGVQYYGLWTALNTKPEQFYIVLYPTNVTTTGRYTIYFLNHMPENIGKVKLCLIEAHYDVSETQHN